MKTGRGILGSGSRFGALTTLATVLACCQGELDIPVALPALPVLDMDAMSPGARKALGSAWDRAIRNPDDGAANGALAMTLHTYELREESVDVYRRATVLDRQDWRWRYYLGLVLAELGRHPEAVHHLRTASALNPESVATRIRLGESLLNEGRWTASKIAFEEALALDPSSAAAHYGLARALESAGDQPAALRSFLQAVDRAPKAGAIRYRLAMLYQSLGRTVDAGRQLAVAGGRRQEPPINDPLLAALRELRGDHLEHLDQGLRLESEGLLADAIRAYEQAVEADASYVQPHVNLVAAYGKLKRVDDAFRHYHHALRLAPDSSELHINWGTLMAQTGRLEEAAASFRRALEIVPRSGTVHADLAWVLAEGGNDNDAREHYRLALRYDPGNRAANFHVARRLIGANRVAEAIRHLLRTIEPVDERTPTYLYGLADAYMRIDDPQNAVEHLRRALDLANKMGQTDLAVNLERDLRTLEAAARP